jgi:exoribonuclease R
LDRFGAPVPTPDEAAAAAEAPATLALAKRFLKDDLGRKATAESARQLLVGLGVWGTHENLELVKRRTPVAFSDALLAEADAVAAAPPVDADASKRRDLRHLRAFAIDSVRGGVSFWHVPLLSHFLSSVDLSVALELSP